MSSKQEAKQRGLKIGEILQADDFQVEGVECPEWDGTVYVRTIGADERDRVEFQVSELEEKAGTRAAIVAAALCDADGTPQKVTAAEVQALGRKASGPVDRLFDVVLTLNRMRQEDVEKLEGNSGATPSPGSG